jgi:hypothetical protein
LAAPCKFSTELFYERASRGQIRKTPPKIDLFFYDNSPPVPHLNFLRPVKLRHSAVYFDIQYIIGDGKLDDVGIFALVFDRLLHHNGPCVYLRMNSGSLAIFTAIRRASSLLSSLAADKARPPNCVVGCIGSAC